MNSKKKSRTSIHGSSNVTNSQDILSTPKSDLPKQNLFTSCRRVGLNRKRNKSLSTSPSNFDKERNIRVENDPKEISGAKVHVKNSEIDKLASKTKLLDTGSLKIDTKNKAATKRKRKIHSKNKNSSESDLSEGTPTDSNKSLGISPSISDKLRNIRVENDPKEISGTRIDVKNSDIDKPTSKTKLLDTASSKMDTKNKAATKRKRKIHSKNKKSESDLSEGTRTDPLISANEALGNSKIKAINPDISTIPVSIRLTRCDLDALKLKLSSPEKLNDNTSENIAENNGLPNVNILDVETERGQQIVEKPITESIINTEENKTDDIPVSSFNKDISVPSCSKDISLPPCSKTSLPSCSKTVQADNTSLDSEDSDFYPNVTRRKKKKVLTTKQRNISKPSTSQQKDVISTNNTPCYSDSEDDFVPTPPIRKSLKSESNSQSSEKSEKSKKKKLKLKKSDEDELNKTGHIRISENKSYTIIHKGNTVSYVKSFDNDVNFKVTESDDNQQLPRNSVQLPKKTMIIERRDYIANRRNSDSDASKIIMEMPSMFDDVIEKLGNAKEEFCRIQGAEDDIKRRKELTKRGISVIEAARLKEIFRFVNKKKSRNKTEPNLDEKSEKEIFGTNQITENLEPFEHKKSEQDPKISEIIQSFENLESSEIKENDPKICKTGQISENLEPIEHKKGEQDPKISETEQSFKNLEPSETEKNDPKISETEQSTENLEPSEHETDSQNEDSSLESEESDDSFSSIDMDLLEKCENINFSGESSNDSPDAYDPSEIKYVETMSKKRLKMLLKTLMLSIENTDTRYRSLKRIRVYKETHDLKKLREVTLQIRKGSQQALIEFIANTKNETGANFTTQTFLDYVKIPNELVGYDAENDEFI